MLGFDPLGRRPGNGNGIGQTLMPRLVTVVAVSLIERIKWYCLDYITMQGLKPES